MIISQQKKSFQKKILTKLSSWVIILMILLSNADEAAYPFMSDLQPILCYDYHIKYDYSIILIYDIHTFDHVYIVHL